MKIASWNVNSIRVREGMVLDWIEAHQPDVLCLQETKSTNQEFPEDGFHDLDYEVCFEGERSYNGVALVSKLEPKAIQRGFVKELPSSEFLVPIESEKRSISAVYPLPKNLGAFEKIRIVSVYVPNGQNYGSEKFQFKLAWLNALHLQLKEHLTSPDPIVVLGDFNIAPKDIDVWDIQAFTDGLFISQQERNAFSELLKLGFVDAYAQLNGSPGGFTWWDYRGRSFEQNQGMRIDHALVDKRLIPYLKSFEIFTEIRGKPQPSDHVPILITLV